MKKLNFLFLLPIAALLVSADILYHTGSPGGKTGSPGDSGSCADCHNGGTEDGSSWISTNIPETGYVPNSTYTIELHGTHSGAARYGFEMTSEDINADKLGTFIVTNGNTQLVNAQATAITHTSSGISPVNDSASFSFEWTAPEAGNGDISLYFAVNAADGNGVPSNDVVYLGSSSFSEDIPESNNELSSKDITIYPNPASDKLNIEHSGLDQATASIYTMNGKLVHQKNISSTQSSIDVRDLPAGYYFLKLQSDNNLYTHKFVIQ